METCSHALVTHIFKIIIVSAHWHQITDQYTYPLYWFVGDYVLKYVIYLEIIIYEAFECTIKITLL